MPRVVQRKLTLALSLRNSVRKLTQPGGKTARTMKQEKDQAYEVNYSCVLN